MTIMKKDDNITFMTKMMTFSKAGALIHPFVFTALEYYSKVILSKKDLDTGMVNPESWKLCAREVLEKLNKHLEREPSKPDHCPDCGAAPGELHKNTCDQTICPACGSLYFTCGCPDEAIKGLPQVPWRGEPPAITACKEYNLYIRDIPGKWNVPCSGDDEGAREDLDRLYTQGAWDVSRQKWAMPQT
jgi:hypothetical protein